MRPAWAALGIILLLVGAFLVLQASSGYDKTSVDWDKDQNPGDMFNSITVSRFLNQDDFFKVEIYAASDWIKGMEQIGTGFYKASFVNITDPFGAQTEFECDFLYAGSPNNAMIFYNITGTGGPNMTTVDAHGIDNVRFELPYGNNKPGIVARALSSGMYSANMTWLFGGGSPPYEMKLSRGVIVTSKLDYTDLYPVGVGVFVVSVALLVYGFGKPKKTVPKGRQTRTRSA
jgi:hypothetical protein